MSVLAFALAGVALIGVPPSGAYLAKELLLQAATGTEQWWWAVAIQAGGILTSSYVVLVLAHALMPADQPVTSRVRLSRIGQAAALALALCSLLLGLVSWQAYLPVTHGPTPTVLQALSSSIGPVLGGVALAILLGRWGDPSPRILATIGAARRAALILSGGIERSDGVLRQWPAAGLCMLVLAIAFAAAMLAGR
jgi:NADH:ubiquinone oxidoreductase subunit 5 (subunit L)/multisubunit Na+/H+ antiporter MnhA subunit